VLLLDYQARCQFEISEPVRVGSQETYATAEGHRRHGDFEFIDDTEVQVLLDRIRRPQCEYRDDPLDSLACSRALNSPNGNSQSNESSSVAMNPSRLEAV
jgi:hypothetical protein